MDPKNTSFLRMETPNTAPGMDLTEDLPADVDEPPEQSPQRINFWTPQKPVASNAYAKAVPPQYMRRESLLTRQLHSENEHSEDEHHVRSPIRGLSMVSTCSNPSTVSTAELTSDDGRSVPSPGISPLLPPTRMAEALPVHDKPLAEPKILGLDSVAIKDPVEAGLGRKRCIKFACGDSKEKSPVKTSPPPPIIEEEKPASPPKRKCALKFMCPSKPTEQQKPALAVAAAPKRVTSPPPKHRRTSSSPRVVKAHRGSDSTVTNPASPRVSRKAVVETPRAAVAPKLAPTLDNSDDSGAEATRFHEFATSEDEPDEWTQESTCYRNRLCVTDTLKKENVIRQLGQEVEEEVLAEEDEEEDDDVDDQDDAEEEQDDIDEEEDESESDDGFHSDDEEGFAGSDDDDGEGSDCEWWAPGALSTAATSTEQLEHLTRISAQPQPLEYPSSLASMSSDNASPRSRRPRPFRTHSKTAAVTIDRPATPDLPDSTDFVCGTLDEDRPKEQAYINCMKEREAAKHRPVPQDIDPTFPTSDPEMDEEDDEDLEDPEKSSAEEIMHGSLDSIHGTARRISPTPRRTSIRQRSPAPSAIRHKSPAPTAIRRKSPAPTAIRHRSPAPTTRHRSPAPVRTKSPAPHIKPTIFSPPPRTHSPAPRKLFGQSPRRARSPAPAGRMTSPPNTRRASPSEMFVAPATGLAGRPNTLTVAASLPKRPGGFLLSRLGHPPSDTEAGETPTSGNRSGRRRGAIDIVKGLEKKKQRRREKLCQKLAAKAAARGEERKKVKPGRGAERMREVGLELQRYKGRAGHILSY